VDDRKPRGPVWLIAVAGIVAILLIARCGMTTRQSDVTAAAEATAYELERTPVKGLGITIFDVENALAHGARDYRGRSTAGSIRVTDAGSDQRGDLYEFTNDDGDYPVCLSVRLDVDLGDDDPSFPDVDVEEGHC
jgi:hypothetical protein